MKRITMLLTLAALGGCGEPEPSRTSAQGPISRSAPPAGAPQQSSQRPSVDIHVVLTRSLADSEKRMGKPARVEKSKDGPGEWRIYTPRGFGELRVRYANGKPAEIAADLARPSDSPNAALRQMALNESRPPDESTDDKAAWKGAVGYEPWETISVTRTDKGWAKVHGFPKPGAAP